MSTPRAQQIELVSSLEYLLREARAGRLLGISYSASYDLGMQVGFAGQYSGRRVALRTVDGQDTARRIVAVEDPFSTQSHFMGAER